MIGAFALGIYVLFNISIITALTAKAALNKCDFDTITAWFKNSANQGFMLNELMCAKAYLVATNFDKHCP